jgi:hypothetical protein
MMLGALPGIDPTLGWKSTPQSLEGALKEVTLEQKRAELGSEVFQMWPYPLDPTVM